MEIRSDVRIYGGVFLIALVAVAVVILTRAKNEPPKVTNFQECVLAGYKVMESYPRQCTTPSGRIFVERIIEAK